MTEEKKVIEELNEKIQSLESQLDFIEEQNKYINKIEKEFYKKQKELEALKNNILQLIKDVDEYDFNFWGYKDFKEVLKNSLNDLLVGAKYD